MKRPFAVIGFTYLISLMVASYFGAGIAMKLAIAMFCSFILSLIIKQTRVEKVIPIIFLVSTIALGIYSVACRNIIEPVTELEGESAVISGVVCELPIKSYGRYYYIVKVDSIKTGGDIRAVRKTKVRISSSEALEAQEFDRITTKVNFFSINSSLGYNLKPYYDSKGIHIFAYIPYGADVKVSDSGHKTFYYYALKTRKDIANTIEILLPKIEASIAKGILLGDKFGISEQTKRNFSDVGVYHILAVSGMHTSIIGFFIFKLLLFLKTPKRLSALITSLGIFGFMAVTCFSPSVMRAGIMAIVYFIGLMIGRQRDSLNSLGFAVLLITALNPFSGGDVGLQLSFSATLGIILLQGKVSEWIRVKVLSLGYLGMIISKCAGLIAMTVSVTIASLPIMIFVYRKVSLISVVSNILIVPVITFEIIFTILAVCTSKIAVLSFISKPITLILTLIIRYILFCVETLAKIPFASVSTGQPFVLLCLASTLLLLGICLIFKKWKSSIKTVIILSFIILMAGIFSYQVCMRNTINVAILDTGKGCAAVITKGERSAVAFCGEGSIGCSQIDRYLYNHNIRNLGCLLVPNGKGNTARYFKKFRELYKSEITVVPDKELYSNANKTYGDIMEFNGSARVSFLDNVEISVDNDDAEYGCIKVGDVTIFMTADTMSDDILAKHRNSDIFVTSNPSQNYSLISPIYTVLTMGLNDVINAVSAYNIRGKNLISTEDSGSVIIQIENTNKICIRRER